MNNIIEAFGDLPFGQVIVIVAGLIAVYKGLSSYNNYIRQKTLKDAEKDKKFDEVINQVSEYPKWHQQSIDAQERINNRFQILEDKIDTMNDSLTDVKNERKEDNMTTSRHRILRFADELRHEPKHSKEHFDQILDDIREYENYCDTHPNYKNDKARFAVKRIRKDYEEEKWLCD